MSTAELHDPTAAFLADLAAVPPPSDPGFATDLAAQRAFAHHGTEAVWRAHAEAGPEVDEVGDLEIDLGDRTVRARIHRPIRTGRAGAPSLHLHLCGGGWWQGSVEQWIVDVQCRERADLGDAVVVSIDYRKAPEHPFPAGLDDAVAVLAWLADRRTELGTSERLTVSGVSAGANLAAAVALRGLAEGGPRIDHLVLEAFPAELRPDRAEFWEGPASGSGVGRDALVAGLRAYLANPDDAASPYASPLAAPDLTGMPPTTILVGRRDPLRAGAAAFAARLEGAGGPVRLCEFDGFGHHTSALTRTVPDARRWRAVVGQAVAGIDTW